MHVVLLGVHRPLADAHEPLTVGMDLLLGLTHAATRDLQQQPLTQHVQGVDDGQGGAAAQSRALQPARPSLALHLNTNKNIVQLTEAVNMVWFEVSLNIKTSHKSHCLDIAVQVVQNKYIV